jgi:hypothetical protein
MNKLRQWARDRRTKASELREQKEALLAEISALENELVRLRSESGRIKAHTVNMFMRYFTEHCHKRYMLTLNIFDVQEFEASYTRALINNTPWID